ncbi:hypothetical protein JCM6882_007110 [Rhodosporidiobolus microsporus]
MPPPALPRSASARSLAAPPVLSGSSPSPSPSPSSASSSTATLPLPRPTPPPRRATTTRRSNNARVAAPGSGAAADARGKGKARALEGENDGEGEGESSDSSSEEEDSSDEEDDEAEETTAAPVPPAPLNGTSEEREEGEEGERVEPPDPGDGRDDASSLSRGADEGEGKEEDGGVEDEEEEYEEESEEEDEDDGDDEPTLKYARLGAPTGTADVLGKETASAVAVCGKYIIIGTHNGAVFVLSPEGKLVKQFQPHSAMVNDLSVDIASEFVASASMDGRVAIHPLSSSPHSEPPQIFDLGRPLRCVALDPYFAKRTTRQFVSGGMAGSLILSEKGWLGHKEVTIYSGEGPVWAAEWRGTFIAWASDAGVRIYDTATSQRITYISRAEDSPRADLFKCTLHWQDDRTLLIGWADYIKVAVVKERETRRAVPGVSGVIGAGSELYVEVTAIFQVDCMVSGLAPYGWDGDLLVLAYLTEEEEEEDDEEEGEGGGDRAVQQKRPEGIMPELRIISREGEELSSDAIALKSYERFQCRDYSLAPTADGTAFYVVAPMDVVVVQTRDEEDHVVWLIEQRRYEEALVALEKTGKAHAGGFDVTDVGKKYLEFLVDDGQYEKAAEACPKLLGINAKLWEDWVFLFAEKGQLKTIIPFVPTHDPQLSRLVYEMIIAHFLRHDQEALLRTIKAWPPEIYDVGTVILAIKDYLERAPKSTLLLQAISELYILARQPGKALPYLIQLREPHVFSLIREHNLFTDVQDQALLLIEFDEDLRKQRSALEREKEPTHGTAIGLLVDHTHSIPIPRVVSQLQDHRKFLYMYLDALFDKDAHLAFDYSDLQVDLYAEYNPAKLMEFLRASNYYSLERAYKVCDARDLVPEMVFLLGRMGDNKRALNLIIERLGDVERAIEFAKEQNDNDLWEDLLRYSETKPRFIRGLLENVGAEIDPIRLIRRIKNGLEIPGLKPALIKILQDFQLQISLMEGCKSILFTDCRHLALALHDSQTNGFLWTGETADKLTGEPIFPHLSGGAVPAALPFAVRFLSGPTYTSTSAFPSLAPTSSSSDTLSLSSLHLPTFTKRDALVAAALLASSSPAQGEGEGLARGLWTEAGEAMEVKVEGVKELRGVLREERKKRARRERRAAGGAGDAKGEV